MNKQLNWLGIIKSYFLFLDVLNLLTADTDITYIYQCRIYPNTMLVVS